MVRVIPIRPVDNGIDAQPIDAHAGFASPAYLVADLANPASPSSAKVAGLAHYNGPPIPIVDLSQQCAEREPAGIAGRVFPAEALVRVFPLIGVVVVDAYDIE